MVTNSDRLEFDSIQNEENKLILQLQPPLKKSHPHLKFVSIPTSISLERMGVMKRYVDKKNLYFGKIMLELIS